MRATAFAFSIVFAASTRAHAEPCRNVALSGDRELVAAIEPILNKRGITVATARSEGAESPSNCRPIKTEVERGGGQVMVWLIDRDGRHFERLFGDSEAAATTIESWARHDLIDPLFAARAVLPVGPISSPVVVQTTPDEPSRRFTLVAGVDTGVGDDGALWSGLRVQGCAAIERFCIGGSVRYAIDLERTGRAATQGDGRRTLELAVAGELPLRSGRVTVTPNLGVGQIAVTATGVDPADDSLEEAQASAVQVRAGVAFAIRVARSWSIRTDFALAVAPGARTAIGDGSIDPMTMMPDKQLHALSVVQGWLGIGIAFGDR